MLYQNVALRKQPREEIQESKIPSVYMQIRPR